MNNLNLIIENIMQTKLRDILKNNCLAVIIKIMKNTERQSCRMEKIQEQ